MWILNKKTLTQNHDFFWGFSSIYMIAKPRKSPGKFCGPFRPVLPEFSLKTMSDTCMEFIPGPLVGMHVGNKFSWDWLMVYGLSLPPEKKNDGHQKTITAHSDAFVGWSIRIHSSSTCFHTIRPAAFIIFFYCWGLWSVSLILAM